MTNGAAQEVTPAESLMTRVLERIRGTANVEAVYGEPRIIGDKTIIPIAALAFGFGAGAGSGRSPAHDGGTVGTGSGGGGGGGVRVQPIALLEVTEGHTKVVPVIDWTSIIRAAITVVVPLLAGRVLLRLFRR